MEARDLLLKQIIEDANNGDTTVLAEILEQCSYKVILASLDGENLELVTDKPNFNLSDFNKIFDEEIKFMVHLNERIFDEELFQYRIIFRTDLISDLYMWIGQGSKDSNLMEHDLKLLEKMEDEYIFSSISTNDYICSTDSEFNNTCLELIELNNTL